MVYGVGKQGVQSTESGFGTDLHGVAELIGAVEGVTGASDRKQCGVVLIVFGSGAGDGGGADRSGCGADRLAAGGADWFCGCGKIPLLLAYGAVVGLVNVVTRNNLSGFQIGRAFASMRFFQNHSVRSNLNYRYSEYFGVRM